ncbi:MAG TPA: hypothetical protein VGB42_03715 [Candidatus Thermoplasmatota archaeon]
MDTDRIMALALEEAGMDRTPEDSEVYVAGRDLKRAVFAVDLDSGELALAKQLGFDVAIAHHPCGGSTWAGFPVVLGRHVPIMTGAGVPEGEARAAVQALKDEHGPRTHALNYDRLPSVARLLGLPFMNIHAPADEVGRRVMHEAIAGAVGREARVEAAVRALEGLPEFATTRHPIAVRMGRPDAPLGRWVFVHGAGTNGGYPVASALFRSGVDTVFYIHVDPAHLRRLKEEFGAADKNLVVTGHIASDSVGINVVVRRLRAEGLEVHTMGGVVP